MAFLPFLSFESAAKAISQDTHAPVVEHMRQALLFLVMGAYFVHQWSRQGQTLAMKTWRIKVERPGYSHLSLQTAVVRYLLSWMWVLPALLASLIFHLQHWQVFGAIGAGILLWSATAFFDKDRQFLHDKLTGTRLVLLPPRAKKKKDVAAA